MISKDELQKIFCEFFSEATIEEMFNDADIDKDGKISLDDFMSMMRQYTDSRVSK